MTKQLEALIAEMKAAAEKATPGQWEMECENIWFRDADGYTKHLAYFYQGDDVDDAQDNDNTRFFALANPANVLALIAALEQAQQHENVHYADAAEAEIASLRKRIAELEASETQLICERDNAEEALADMYQAATGERPEWSNFFSFSDAVDAVEQRLGELEASNKQVIDSRDYYKQISSEGLRRLEVRPLAVKLPDRKDIRFWPGDAFEFDTLGYVMAVEESIRAAGGTVEVE